MVTEMWNAMRWAWLVVAFSYLLVGCSSESGREQAPSAAPAQVATLYPSYDAAISDWNNMSSFQRDLLIDGDLSYAEYESAVFAFARCVEESGLRFDEKPKYNAGNRKFEYAIVTGSSQAEASAGDSKIGSCAVEHLTSIQTAWNLINRPTQQDLEKADGVWKICLSEGGETAADIAVIPAWGTKPFEEWIRDHLIQEGARPSAEFPNWRRCLDVVGSQFPTG